MSPLTLRHVPLKLSIRVDLMPVTHVHTYLVPPRTGPAGTIGGAAVALEGKLYEMLNDVYVKSDNQCNIEICFNANAIGAQQNPVEDLIVAYVSNPTLDGGRELAELLRAATDGRSGLGLLFLIKGDEGIRKKIVISRFPADNGILAETDPNGLSVEFLERVFMKNAFAYKAAAYSGVAVQGGFWEGRAVDRQAGDPSMPLSNYWIKGFLKSDFRVTAAAGTRRLAMALKEASRNAEGADAKHALAAAATLARGLNGHQTSGEDFLQRFPLPAEATAAFRAAFRTPAAAHEQFTFTTQEFDQHISYRSVKLDSGAILTAENANFDEVFEQESTEVGRTKFSTTGTVVEERLRGGKVNV